MITAVLMAPMQVKQQLNIGNLYDLLLCDFYTKCLRMRNMECFFPLMINVNGSPIEKIVSVSYAQEGDYYRIATDMINRVAIDCKRFSIQYDTILRDDDNVEEIYALLPKLGVHSVVYCTACGSVYGSDLSIRFCRRCGQKTEVNLRETFAKNVVSSDILKKISTVYFAQPSAKLRLTDFVNSLPDNYDIILEKDRKYTARINGVGIDPRYAAISLLSTARKRCPVPRKIVHIHGDVVKKFTYYVLAYLSDEDIPDVDVMHGNIVDVEHKKLRNCDANGRLDASSLGLNNKEFRAMLLSSSAKSDIVIDYNIASQRREALVKTYVLMSRVCDNRNFIPGTIGLSAEFDKSLKNFYAAVDNWNLPKAFEIVNRLVRECWAKTKNLMLSEEEVKIIKSLQAIYFGD